MAANFSNPDAVLAAYDAVVRGDANWLLLAYDTDVQPDAFQLYASGSDGLPELKSKIEDLQVYIAFYRDRNDFILLNIIPEVVSGVKRARALVHSRRIGGVFQAHQTTLTVDHLSNLTPKSIRQALAEPDSVHVIQVDRVTAEPTDEMGVLDDPPGTTSTPQTSKGSMFSLLRRKKKPEVESGAVEPFNVHDEEEDAPPPPPPKDKGRYSFSYQPQGQTYSQAETPRAPPPRPLPQLVLSRHRSNSDYTVVSHSSSSEDLVVVRPEPGPPSPRSPGIKKRSATMPSKWNTEPVDPAERARRRMELQRQREIEEEQALEEEAHRQIHLKLQKQALLKQQEEEEEERRVSLEQELKRVTAQRRRREQLEREEEERKKHELEEKKRADRERRMEEHRRLEEWRKGQAAQADEAARRTEQARKQEEAKHKKKIQLAGAKVKSASADADLVTGWVTMQAGDSLVWRRRYFKFVGSTVFFYRSLKEKDTNQPLDQIDLRGQVRGLREWNEGYEDLKAIPFAFAVEFSGAREAWSMFSDSEEEKYKLLGLLHAANGA
ncbi:hypothetical protein B0H17DRAFT_1329808 [Mycena rosella]|uniref:ADF-H domain-containing protein n=1 Tax=Mycena rosella TaxID=1033263 RepID=A0AAD7DN12_MYCRO|nr:hypothetical protein B0H17DRAFT_1329808 [Mycena rosella]